MGEVITIGLDIAKGVFQVHGVDGAGAVVSSEREDCASRAKILHILMRKEMIVVRGRVCDRLVA